MFGHDKNAEKYMLSFCVGQETELEFYKCYYSFFSKHNI